ncbi:MAG: peptidase inhibitor I78 [Sphingopyxis sp.]|nr:peptidase inhibitor I78 [Sphingopyxis sp.]
MRRILAIFTAAPLLAACEPAATEPGGSAAIPDVADACGATKLTDHVGSSDSPALRETIAKASGAKAIRWLTPGMAVTMDYRADRLNANIDAAGRYSGFSCG